MIIDFVLHTLFTFILFSSCNMSSAFNREKNIDVKRSNYSVIGSEFDNMRDRFDNEMKRVEDEMARLRREFEGN